MIRNDIRNICIIAHVDHGKTTLVDHLLKQSGQFAEHRQVADRVMDSQDLERERGITILAKNTAIKLGDVKVNVVDTPGHADFGGEVERILGMVDGSILLVDAAEGPLPQTRFVLSKSLERGHKVVLVINKVDRSEVQETDRIQEVVNETFDLFVELGATEEQCEFPIVYACARDGWCTQNYEDIPAILAGEKKADLNPLYNLILELDAPEVDSEDPFMMLLSNLAWSDYVGQLSVGRVMKGKIVKGQEAYRHGLNDKDEPINQKFKVTKLYTYNGLKQEEVEELAAGDIGILAGCNDVYIGDTIAGDKDVEPFPRMKIDTPTLKMIFTINTSPMSGKDGEALQSRKLRERLLRECRANVALQFEETEFSDQFYLCGRGELQFGILIEEMRREGIEFMVGRPLVALVKDEEGNLLEPIELAVMDCPQDFSGEVTDLFQNRKGILSSYENLPNNRVRLTFEIPTRGLLGMRSKYLTTTRGEGLYNSKFKAYEPYKGDMLHRANGSLIADRNGKTTEYALKALEDRGVMFIKPGTDVYEGMIIGECARENDINVNVCKEKKLTNVRSVTSDGLTILQGIRDMNLERCIEWVEDDEWIEVTPSNIRLRKKILPQNQRSVIRGSKKNK